MKIFFILPIIMKMQINMIKNHYTSIKTAKIKNNDNIKYW